MEENSTQNKIEQRLAELPQNVRDAVLSAQTGEHIREIGQKHGLHIDQVGKLEDEAMLVMLGFFEPDKFSIQIQEQLGVSATDAATIAQDVSVAVFSPIRESLKKILDSKRPTQTPVEEKLLPPPATAHPLAVAVPSIPLVTTSPPAVVPAVTVQPMPAVEKMLTEKTVVVPPSPVLPPQTAQTPAPIYKTDPYREPLE